jgi:hypothetical protein
MIESNPGMTKTALGRRISGKRQNVLVAISALCAQGYVQTTPGERAPILISIKPYRCDPAEPVLKNGGVADREPPEESAENRFSGTGGNPVENYGGSRQTVCACSGKDGEVRPTATGVTNGGEPAPVVQPRCKVCKSPDLLHRVNTMLANGFTTTAILSAIAGINAALPAKARVTDDSLNRHRHRHFPVQAGASSVWRQLMEQRAATESATFHEGVTNLLTPRIFFETLMIKGYSSLLDEDAEVTVDQAARAAAELNKLVDDDDAQHRMAQIVAKQNVIIDIMRSLPGEAQQIVLAKLDGKPYPPPRVPALALVEGGDDDFGDDDFDEYDDED